MINKKFLSSFVRKDNSDCIATPMSRYFSCLITEGKLLTSRFTWRLLVMYMMNPTFEGSVHVLSLAFHAWALGLKYFRYSLMCLLKVLGSSGGQLNRSPMCMLHGLAWGVPSNSHLLKLSRYRSSCQLFHYSSIDSLLGSLDRGCFYWKDVGLFMSTPL